MAISARIPSGLDTSTFIPKEYSRNVLYALKSKLVVVPNVNHSYEPDLQLGNILYITQSQTGTATEVTVGTEGAQADPTTTGITLTIDKWFERPYTVDYMSRRQSHVNLVALAEVESAYAISKKIDSTLCALFSALGSVAGVKGTSGSAWTDDVLIACVEVLDEGDVDEANRVWIADPSTKADIMGIDKFVRADYFASDAIPTGGFRKDIYGAPLLTTNNLTAHASLAGAYGVYMHRDAVAIVIQEDPDVDRVEQPLKHQIVINTTALWGVKEIRDISGVAIHTRLA